MSDLDSAMDVLDTLEKKNRDNDNKNDEEYQRNSKILIGTVEGFFDKIGVVAIHLNDELNVGDIIEIGTYDDAIRQKVTSMQIDRQDVETAYNGDSVGIKLKYKVDEGSSVYRIKT